MAFVYILYSQKLNRFYTGSCLNLDVRLDEHMNKKYPGFTSNAEDWELFFSVPDLQYQQARNIEEHIKKMKSRHYIENLKKYPDIINRLIKKYEH